MVQRMLLTGSNEPEGDLARPVPLRFEHDFSAINKPGDRNEQVANLIAEKVMHTPEPRLQHASPCCGGSTTYHAEQSDRKHESLRANGATVGEKGRAGLPLTVHDVLQTTGQPLDPGTRDFMETRFGYDFSRVRMHLGAMAERSARDVNAHAYTVGQDIVFGASRFAPGTHEGRRLIAHELAHTVQQSHGAPLTIARAPAGTPFVANQQDIVYLRNTMLRFYNLLTPDARASLARNTTVVIALVTEANMPTLVYAVASNSINPHIRAAAERLGLARWDPKGIDKVAGELHAEQLLLEAAANEGFKVHAMAVTREPCKDCGPVVADEKIPIEWVRDPNPTPRTPGTSGGRPAGGAPPSTLPDLLPDPAKTAPRKTGTSKLTEEVGAPIEPVVEATPGFHPAKGAGIGGAFQILQAIQFANLQRAEIDKFQSRYAELQPDIEAFLGKGYSVELLLIVEVPDRFDFSCAARIFCDASQFVYFRELYINYVETVKPVVSPSAPTSYPTIGPAGGRSGHVPFTFEGGSIRDEKEIRFLSARHADHHCEYRKQTLYP
jgi:hypothetical protein